MQTLIEIPANLSHMFHDDPIVAKYRTLLGLIVYQLFIASKRDRPALLARKEQIHRQIRGRQIRLYKASQESFESMPVHEHGSSWDMGCRPSEEDVANAAFILAPWIITN